MQSNELDYLRAIRRDLVRRYNRIKKQHQAAKNRANLEIKIFAVIGAILGIVFTVNEMLVEHGPTVTVLGTIGAQLLYGLGGLVGSALAIWLVREGVELELDHLQSQLDEIVDTIDDIDEELDTYELFFD